MMPLLLRKLGQRYSAAYTKSPYRMSFVTCFVKGCMADVIAQTAVEKKRGSDVSLRRTFLFGMWSGAYCGSAQHFIFNVVFSRMFGTATMLHIAFAKAASVPTANTLL